MDHDLWRLAPGTRCQLLIKRPTVWSVFRVTLRFPIDTYTQEPSPKHHSANKNDIVLWRASRSEVGVARQVLSRVFCLALPHLRFSVLYSDTLSARDVGFVLVPCATGSLTARVLVNSGSALLRVSTSSLVLRQSSPGTVRPLSHWLVSAAPRILTVTHPSATPRCFPIQM